MADLDADELRKLSPEERIKKLKEIEDKRKKDLELTDKLIRESFTEIEESEEVPEEQEILPPPEEENNLEAQLEAEEVPPEEQQNVEYAINLYGEFTDAVQSDGYQRMARAAEIYDKIKVQEQYMGQDETVKKIAEGSRRMMEELFGEYRANLEYNP